VGERCTTCHLPHQARVDASDCAGCHAAVRTRKAGEMRPPLPFDTTAALRRVSLVTPPPRFTAVKGKGDASFVDDPPALVAPHAPPDTFPHDRHQSLSCITCHLSRREHGRLAFETPRGCQICHHQAPATAECATCHRTDALAAPESVTVRVMVERAPPRSHPTLFDHARHARLKCVDCHTTPVSLAPGAETLRCAACHDDHHAAGRSCATCHTEIGPEARVAHAPPIDAHQACDACHLPQVVARLVPDRTLCLTCHAAQREHYAAQECTTCHFQATPAEFQVHLRRAEAGS
jgi:LSD1 subclass zinc finger protein